MNSTEIVKKKKSDMLTAKQIRRLRFTNGGGGGGWVGCGGWVGREGGREGGRERERERERQRQRQRDRDTERDTQRDHRRVRKLVKYKVQTDNGTHHLSMPAFTTTTTTTLLLQPPTPTSISKTWQIEQVMVSASCCTQHLLAVDTERRLQVGSGYRPQLPAVIQAFLMVPARYTPGLFLRGG